MTETRQSDSRSNKAERWIIEPCGYPREGWQVVGFAGDHPGAVQISDAIAKAPGCTSTRIRDSKASPCA